MTSPQKVPEDRIRVFSNDGLEKAQFRVDVSRSWAIGEEGRAEFTLPLRKTSIANETTLQYGNWLLVENSILPPWVGVIDTPRTFNADSVTVSAYTPDHVFAWRRGGLQDVWQASPGILFARMIAWINSQQVTIIKPGQITQSNLSITITINPKKMDTYLYDLVTASQEEYDFFPAIEAGKLSILANWAKKLGEATGAILQIGKRGGNVEIQDGIVVEDGAIVNDILAYGDGATWSSKPMAQSINNTSASRYCLRQDAWEFQGADATTLSRYAKNGVTIYGEPDRAFALNALNIGDTFKYMKIGNHLSLRRENAAGFWNFPEIPIRIIGMGYNPAEGAKISLVVKQVI